MTRRVTFKTLWLVSAVEQKAKKQTFSSGKTILHGKNGTGKSRIIKNLFWTLGCSPAKHMPPGWDPDTIGALEFTFDGKTFVVVRKAKTLGLFDDQGLLIEAVDNLTAWDRFIAHKFGYMLMLQRPGTTKQSSAGIDYLTLPFYIDQDGSWGEHWDTYTNLAQFSKWQKPVFEAFIGLRPNAYFTAYQKCQLVRSQRTELQKQLNTEANAFQRVRELLPKNVPVIDSETFEQDLVGLGLEAKSLQSKQNELRARVITATGMKEKVIAELALATSSLKEVSDDLGYLSGIDDALECPTCGTVHTESFHGRLNLAQDVDALVALIAELQNEKGKITFQLQKLKTEYVEVVGYIQALNERMTAVQSNLKAEKLLFEAHSVQTLHNAFAAVTADLVKDIAELEYTEDGLAKEYKQFEDKKRTKDVGDYYAAAVNSQSIKLNVPFEEQLNKPKVGARGDTGGSSGPRTLLAVHLAMLQSNAEYGDMPMFPFVVDTPQQSGQDHDNLRSMIEVLGKTAGEEHQVILAVEMLPPGVDTTAFEVVNYTVKRGLLNDEDFAKSAFIAGYLRIMQDHVANREK